MTESDFPPHTYRVVSWRQATRGGSKADRMLAEITVAVPPFVADLDYRPGNVLASTLLDAATEIARTDAGAGTRLQSLGRFLIRTESVASSKIEQVEADADDFVRAIAGVRSNASATSMVAATDALTELVERAGATGAISLDDILAAHRILMSDDPTDQRYAGQLRTVQNWIGGSDWSQRNAVHVPPPPELVPELIDDLLVYANRDDVDVITQAAVVHAQFESIHPFTDGNGRIGRALINAILRHRGATARVVVPLASALVAHRERYFDALTAYRNGDVAPIISSFATSSRVAAVESTRSAARLRQVVVEWRDQLGPTRANSAAAKLLAILPSHPILSADDACNAVEAPRSSVFAAISRFHEAGVLRPLTD